MSPPIKDLSPCTCPPYGGGQISKCVNGLGKTLRLMSCIIMSPILKKYCCGYWLLRLYQCRDVCFTGNCVNVDLIHVLTDAISCVTLFVFETKLAVDSRCSTSIQDKIVLLSRSVLSLLSTARD